MQNDDKYENIKQEKSEGLRKLKETTAKATSTRVFASCQYNSHTKEDNEVKKIDFSNDSNIDKK